jgi:hypothetical protein
MDFSFGINWNKANKIFCWVFLKSTLNFQKILCLRVLRSLNLAFNDTHDCDFNMQKSDFYTQSVIATRSVILRRTNVILTRIIVILTRRVWFIHAECDLYTQSVISIWRVWFQHAQMWFPHAECDFDTYECDYDTNECDYDPHECDYDTHECDLNTDELNFELNFNTMRVTLKITN